MLWSKVIGAGGTLGGGVITLVGHATSTVVGASSLSVDLTSLTGGVSSAPETGDLVLVFISGTGYSTNNYNIGSITTSGYTTPVDKFAFTGGGNYRAILTVGHKVMGATPDLVVSCSAATYFAASQIAHVRVYRGVDAVTPMDVTPSTASGANVVVDPPSITPVSSGFLVVSGGNLAGQYFDSGSYSSSDLDNVISSVVGSGDFQYVTLSAWGDSFSTLDPAALIGTGIPTYINKGYTAATIALRPA